MLAVGEAAAAAATFVAESERLTEFIVESERVFVRRLFQEEGDAAGAVAEMMIFELSLAAAVFLMLSMVLLLLLEPALLMLTAPALLLLLLLLLLLELEFGCAADMGGLCDCWGVYGATPALGLTADEWLFWLWL